MKTQELAARYQQAKLLFIMKEYHDALDILDDLLMHSPHNANLLCAKAKCLAALGLRDEAEEICSKLLAEKGTPGAFTLLRQLRGK